MKAGLSNPCHCNLAVREPEIRQGQQMHPPSSGHSSRATARPGYRHNRALKTILKNKLENLWVCREMPGPGFPKLTWATFTPKKCHQSLPRVAVSIRGSSANGWRMTRTQREWKEGKQAIPRQSAKGTDRLSPHHIGV